MATCIFRGDAPKIAQVNTWAFGGTWEADDYIRVTFATGRYYDFVAGSTTTATVVSNMVTAWNLLSATTYPEWAELTASADTTTLTLTSDTAGVPFACTLTPFDVGGAADAQTIAGGTSAAAGTIATANSGPNDWSVAGNWSGGAVPVSTDTVYIENTSVDILDGFAQSAVTLTALYIAASYTGKIGRAAINSTGTTPYYEYRATQLAISATTCEIGSGGGNGSGRIKINFGSVATTTTVFNTGTSAESGLAAFQFVGTSTSNVLHAYGGTIGVAQLAWQSAALDLLNMNGSAGSNRFAAVYCGSGVATAIDVVMTGGNLTLAAGSTTLNMYGGTAILAAGNHPTINVYGGTAILNSTGTLGGTLVTVGGTGTIDLDQNAAAKTLSTDIQAHRGATIKNGNGSLATLNVDAVGCRMEELNIVSKVGSDVTIA